MDRLNFSFILGYHGCCRSVAEKILSGEESFRDSENLYDWLGRGAYFWEANPRRALEFAREAMARKGSTIKDPYVVGAVIDLGSCLDLTTSAGIGILRLSYGLLTEALSDNSAKIPANHADRMRRYLDCAVINWTHQLADAVTNVPRFDSVRGTFEEGEAAYPGAGFKEKTHTQIAVCNQEHCIKGVFRVHDRYFN